MRGTRQRVDGTRNVASDLREFGPVVGQRHEDAVGARFDVTKGPLDRCGGVRLLAEPIGVDSGVDENLGVALFDSSNFRLPPGAGSISFSSVLSSMLMPAIGSWRDIVGHRVGIIAISVFDVDADVAL